MILVQYVRLLYNDERIRFYNIVINGGINRAYTLYSKHITNRHEQDNSLNAHRHR